MATNMSAFDIFLSYNRESSGKIVKEIHLRLKEIGYKVWIDNEQIKPNDSMIDKMTEGILDSELFISFINESYCKSKICTDELKFANSSKKKVMYVYLQDLKKEPCISDKHVERVRFQMKDQKHFKAYGQNKTFEPWSEQLFDELRNYIIEYNPEFAKKDQNQKVKNIASNSQNNTSYNDKNWKIDNNNHKMSSAHSNTSISYDVQKKASTQIKTQKVSSLNIKFNNLIVLHEQFKCRHNITKAHDDFVFSLVMINNNTFASGSNDKSIKIWDTKNYTCIHHITKAHDNSVLSLVIINNKTLVSGSDDKSIKIWNTYNFECMHHITKAHDNSVSSLFMINNNTFASGSVDKSIKIWDSNNYTCIYHIIKAHNDSISSLVIINNNTFASGSADDSIKIWDTSNYTCRHHITNAHDDSVSSLVMINNSTFASGSLDKSIKVWDSNNYTCIYHIIKAHNDFIWCLVMINNNTFASGSVHSINIWDTNNYTCRHRITKAHRESVFSLVMINNNTFVSGSLDNSIKIWDDFTD